MISESLRQDDLYVQMSYAVVFDRKGPDASRQDIAESLKNSKFQVWHANQAARRALHRGADPNETGTPKYSTHLEDIGTQITTDFIGLMCPGLPRTSSEIEARVGQITSAGSGCYAGMFVCGMYTEAPFEKDVRKVVEAGLRCIPPDAEYAATIRDVLEWSKSEPDWTKTWQKVQDKYEKQDNCPYGALMPLNIDARINGAYTTIGLLYGGDDFAKTVEIAMRCGQDSDCNPCTVGGVWGMMHGFDAIPRPFTDGIPSIAHEKFSYTDYDWNALIDSSIARAEAIVKKNGGRIENGEMIIPRQIDFAPVRVREFPELGRAVERIDSDNSRWKFTGEWTREVNRRAGIERIAGTKGASAEIEFEGTGAVIVGPYLGNGGQAEVYLDGQLDRTIDVWPDDEKKKLNDAVWWKFNLPKGKHTVKLLVKGESFGGSTGTEIRVQDLVVYRPK
ncbi:MAG TPA: ADP-ribosylglycohydrolase family protein [Tepidisphaeraceae bacterium]|nr:ADP-ribosylglycohydrolase family protein [Tepidisphaeraceae bacterium]